MRLLKIFQSFLGSKIEKRKLEIQNKNELGDQVLKDHAEFILIAEKKSTLSKKQRDLVVARIDAYIALGYIKVIDDEKE